LQICELFVYVLSNFMSSSHHAINAVVRRTGLSAHVIRIWEKRYGAVEPERTATNRRLYSDAQVERLMLLHEITQAGQSIGYVAKLPTEQLKQLAAAPLASFPGAAAGRAASPAAASFFEACLAAVKALNARAFEQALKDSETALGMQGMLQRVAAPLTQTIGNLWRDGSITAAHEHFASAMLRTYLAQASRPFAVGATEPVLIVATPAGQLHELGALLVGALATNLGWHVTYLGASLPAPEIAGAAKQSHARAVALSLVYPEDDPRMEGELTRLRELLPPEVKLIVGGRAMYAYRATLEKIDALQAKDLTHLCATLDELRKPAPSA
jgi:DNA-binding transcriptional MerR regulator/methylmalonyl-CoA mutase cobalamin-binding subunit